MTGRGDGNITIGHVWGIPIQINPSTFLILALVTWTLARPEGLLPDAYPELSAIGLWLTALLTALLFFASILFHELAHQLVYVPGDTPFNEGFATLVEEEGTHRWLASRNDD